LAIQDGSRVRFTGDEAPPPCTGRLISTPPKEKRQQRHPALDQLSSTGLGAIVTEIEGFADWLNHIDGDDEAKLGQLEFAQHSQYLLHRLLSVLPLARERALAYAEKLTTDMCRLLHTVLVAFMTTTLHEYGQRHSRYHLLAQILRDELQQCCRSRCSDVGLDVCDEDDGLMLWALFVAGMSVLEPKKDDEWLLPGVRERCTRLRLTSWVHVREFLLSFMWIDCLHGNAGRALYDAATDLR
jgi:hypothetical protein